MNFCAIGPIAIGKPLLECHNHMALAQYLYDENYFYFYQNILAGGGFVVLDNGAYEGAQMADRELLYWCKRLNPSAVILPDTPHSFVETTIKSARFADKLREMPYHPKMWKVLHAPAGELFDFNISYTMDSRQYDAVCFSRLTANYYNYGRVGFIQQLQQQGLWNPNCYHHALGMVDGDRAEIVELAKLGVNSFDSSNPLWRSRMHKGDFDPFAEVDQSFDYANYLEGFIAQCQPSK